MAFQEGIVRLRGKIGDIVNYRRKGKYFSSPLTAPIRHSWLRLRKVIAQLSNRK